MVKKQWYSKQTRSWDTSNQKLLLRMRIPGTLLVLLFLGLPHMI